VCLGGKGCQEEEEEGERLENFLEILGSKKKEDGAKRR
jgi:hypothetical protein